MTFEVQITPELQYRVDAVASRLGLSTSQVVADALENGHSIAWHEQFFEAVHKGLAAADRDDFSSVADMDRVRNKYRPV